MTVAAQYEIVGISEATSIISSLSVSALNVSFLALTSPSSHLGVYRARLRGGEFCSCCCLPALPTLYVPFLILDVLHSASRR